MFGKDLNVETLERVYNVTNTSYLLILNIYFYFILLYNTVLVVPYIDMNPPWVYMRSQT